MSKYGLKQGAYGASNLVSTGKARMGVAKDVTPRYTVQFTYTAAHSDLPMSIFVTPRENEYLRLRALRGSISYVWRDKTGKLEVQ